MFKKIFFLMICAGVFFSLNAIAQQAKFPQKIKVVLLGTFHYGQTSDKGKTPFPDLFSAKRQQELEQMVNDLSKLSPTQIFVEAVPEKQRQLDSLYALYKAKKLTDTTILRNEIEQLGFRLANARQLPTPLAVDFKQELPYDAMTKFEKASDADSNFKSPPFFETPYPFTDKSQKLSLPSMSLPAYYVKLNSLYHIKANQYDYLHYAMSYGKGADYTGAAFTTSWYNRNLKIYTNILRALKPTDQCIVIIFGSSHTNTMRQFFEYHPAFEIVELDQVIKVK